MKSESGMMGKCNFGVNAVCGYRGGCNSKCGYVVEVITPHSGRNLQLHLSGSNAFFPKVLILYLASNGTKIRKKPFAMAIPNCTVPYNVCT